nr:MAG TPA: hypothetical protein [Caudoviricetes sp.]
MNLLSILLVITLQVNNLTFTNFWSIIFIE